MAGASKSQTFSNIRNINGVFGYVAVAGITVTAAVAFGFFMHSYLERIDQINTADKQATADLDSKYNGIAKAGRLPEIYHGACYFNDQSQRNHVDFKGSHMSVKEAHNRRYRTTGLYIKPYEPPPIVYTDDVGTFPNMKVSVACDNLPPGTVVFKQTTTNNAAAMASDYVNKDLDPILKKLGEHLRRFKNGSKITVMLKP